jgi:hypothetical protein
LAHANRKDRSSATDKAASSDLEHELSFLLDLLSSDYARFRDGLQFIPTRPKLVGVSLDATISAVQYKDSAHCLNQYILATLMPDIAWAAGAILLFGCLGVLFSNAVRAGQR